jgi:hypothetical protein
MMSTCLVFADVDIPPGIGDADTGPFEVHLHLPGHISIDTPVIGRVRPDMQDEIDTLVGKFRYRDEGCRIYKERVALPGAD